MPIMPATAIMTPGAWTRKDLVPDSWIYTLTDDEQGELRAALEQVQARGLDLPSLSPRVFPLPTVGPKLRRLTRQMAEERGFVLLRGFPISDMILEDIERMYFGCMTYVGIPIAQDPRNSLIGHVRDISSADAATGRGYQTSRQLGYHSDSADIVGLLCVQPAKSGGLSKILSAAAVHNIVLAERPDLLRVLYDEPYYPSWSGQEPEGQPPYYWVRFFSWYGDRLQASSIKERYVDSPPMSPKQREALAFIKDVLAEREDELSLHMDFMPGDVQLLDDAMIWHSRTAYIDDEDPAKRRHLLRIWLNYYIERPVSPDFWNRYEMVAQATVSPKRRLFDVPVYDTW